MKQLGRLAEVRVLPTESQRRLKFISAVGPDTYLACVSLFSGEDAGTLVPRIAKGLLPNVARHILDTCFVDGAVVTSADVMERCGGSMSRAANNLTLLENLGLIRFVGLRGSARAYALPTDQDDNMTNRVVPPAAEIVLRLFTDGTALSSRDVAERLRWDIPRASQALGDLMRAGKVQVVRSEGSRRFYAKVHHAAED